uniref:tRNA (guanine(26)-N(2))-dimethyltransferase n=1 Tax=uncultured Poseidoniia archaeon TaxID=1697135 RepID=A0A1B1T9M4_9ARCH|nr:tRNA N2,N2-dimethyl(Guanine26-N2)-methyltransferase (TRMT1, trm1) [uncultured Candidatus Thalassoarchaea sp.]
MEEWPSVIHREGKTLMRLFSNPDEDKVGPAIKGEDPVFYNPAMSRSRTRSVLLMQYAIENKLLGNGPIYAVDGLAATGLRARRWLNELPKESAERIHATIIDMNQYSLDLALKTHDEFPPDHSKGELSAINGDLRSAILNQGWHWVDIDPYGSPTPFLDTAIQSMARKGIIEVSATDTAALTGSSKNPLLRRYGARVRNDGLAHDSALRVLLATVGRVASKHERRIEPLISIWDSHHLRVSMRVIRSIEGANKIEDSLGWRVYSPTHEEVLASIKSGLHTETSLDILPMDCFLPLHHPINRDDERVSGPMWIKNMGKKEVLAFMTEERVLQMCGPDPMKEDLLKWTEKEFDYENRRILRSVKNLANEANAIETQHHILVDYLSSWLKIGSPPSPKKLVKSIIEAGFSASLANYGKKPSIRTDAPWDLVVKIALEIHPPM